MDPPPVPKPRTVLTQTEETRKTPIPLPRTKLPTITDNERVTAADILQSISTASKQFTEDVALKVQSSAKSANDRIEKSISDGTRLAKETFEKTLTTSRAVRDSVTRSLIEGTKSAGLRLRKSKSNSNNNKDKQRYLSLPVHDLTLFENIQFNSPLIDHSKNVGEENSSNVSINSHSDDVSLYSTNSTFNEETSSNVSYESQENDQYLYENSAQGTYDMPRGTITSTTSDRNSEHEVTIRPKKLAYENWSIVHEPIENGEWSNETARVSKSTIYEFDPLNKTASKYEGVSNELLLLQSFLVGDMYGTITNETDEEVEVAKPPTPPERLDSLEPSYNLITVSQEPGNTNWFDNQTELQESKPIQEATKPNMSVKKKVTNILKFDVLNKSNKQTEPKLNTVERPSIHAPTIFFKGSLIRIVSGVAGELLVKNTHARYCLLTDSKLMCYMDCNHSTLKDEFTFESISSLQMVLPLSSSTTPNSYCFELMISSGYNKNNLKKVVFSCTNAIERRTWGQMIIKNLAHEFPAKYVTEFTRFGWCYLKEGVSGQWQGAWIMIIRRTIRYYTTKDSNCKFVDLRKTRNIVTRTADEHTKQICPSDASLNLLLDCPDVTLYLRFQHEKELKGWHSMVKLAAHNNGTLLHHQQLTKEDVPTIVDKCISFLYAYGSLTEGIYRRAGSTTTRTTLLSKFRRDAWSVHLSPTEHSEHDVAGVLKKFFRDLPEPLIHKDLHQRLLNVLDITNNETRYNEYRQIIARESIITRNTIKKLFAHLYFLQSMASVNKMTSQNLASVWAPTLMPGVMVDENASIPDVPVWSVKEILVIHDLISQYETIWKPSEDEKKLETDIRNVLMRVLSQFPPTSPKAAGDLKAWVYVNDRDTCFHVALSPTKTSADICIELSQKAGKDSHLLMLEEVICDGAMSRIINIDEVVLDVVLRWGYWDEDDRKDNYLLVRDNKILYEISAIKATTSVVCGELKFANESTKTFKPFMFEFRDMKLCNFKDKQGSQLMNEWNIKDILWYVGHETKRNPHSRWSITFIPRTKPKRSKDKPFFGCTIAGTVSEDHSRWMAAMMFAEYTNVLPSARLVIT